MIRVSKKESLSSNGFILKVALFFNTKDENAKENLQMT